MTAQSPDILFRDRQRYSLLSNPLESYFSDDRPRPKFLGIRTDNWRGYVAQWEIDEGCLFLTGLHGQVGDDDSQDPTATLKIALDGVFPGNDRGVYRFRRFDRKQPVIPSSTWA